MAHRMGSAARVAVLISFALASWALAGCSATPASTAVAGAGGSAPASASPAPADSTPVTAPPAASTPTDSTPATTPAAHPAPAHSTPATHTPPGPCPASGIALRQLPGDSGASGTIAVRVQLTNTSSRTCTLSGYPSFTLTAHSASMGTDINEPVTLGKGDFGGPFSTPPASISLAPGGTAGFLLAYSNRTASGDGSCDVANKLHLTLPGSNTPVVGPVQIQVCQSTMHVSAYLTAAHLVL